jgi:plastocyanin
VTRRDLLRGGGALALLPLAGAARPALAREHSIAMAGMRFGPAPVGIRVGDTILWLNRDPVPHSATARNGSFDAVLPAGSSVRTIVRRAGTIAFYCRYHPTMRGTLAVAPR